MTGTKSPKVATGILTTMPGTAKRDATQDDEVQKRKVNTLVRTD